VNISQNRKWGTLFAIFVKTESTYIMIESTRWFDDIRVGPDLPSLDYMWAWS